MTMIKKHISLIKANDVVLCTDGHKRTVGVRDIKYGFMRSTLFGDSYKLGTVLVDVCDKATDVKE